MTDTLYFNNTVTLRNVLFRTLVLPPVLVPTNVEHKVPSIMPSLAEEALPENRVYPSQDLFPSPPVYPPPGMYMYMYSGVIGLSLLEETPPPAYGDIGSPAGATASNLSTYSGGN